MMRLDTRCLSLVSFMMRVLLMVWSMKCDVLYLGTAWNVSDTQSWAGDVHVRLGSMHVCVSVCVSDGAVLSDHVPLCALPEIRDHSSRPHMLRGPQPTAIFTCYTSPHGRELPLSSPAKHLLIEPSHHISWSLELLVQHVLHLWTLAI